MSRKYKFRNNEKIYFISFAIVGWIDLFIRDEYRQVMIQSWKHCQKTKGLEIYGWVIMTSHIHMIVGSHGQPLAQIMQDMKGFTSKELRKIIETHRSESRKEWMLEIMTRAGSMNSNNVAFQLWQQDNHPIELITPKMAWQKLNYIHDNPVKSGFVSKPEDFIYSSAGDYFGNRGLVEVRLLEPLFI